METLARAANRGSIPTGYDIDNSLKFEADNTELIYRTNNSGTNSKTFTVSVWFKRTELGVDQQVWHGGTFGEATRIGISSYQVADDSLWVDVAGGTGNSGTQYRSFSTLKIRDTSAWYHVCVAVDTTQATEANRMKVWLNGEEVTDWAQHQIPAQNFQCALESGTQMAWGGYRPSNLVLFSGYLAECHYLDGVVKVQTDFGEYDEDSGIWIPKKYTGTYGNNGCYMKYNDSSALGADSSGNGNNFTLNNITSADQSTDTPTNNFCTMNPYAPYLYRIIAASDFTNGATQVTKTNSNAWCGAIGTMGVKSGKWYYEARVNDNDNLMLGFSTFTGDTGANQSPHTIGTNIVWYGGGVSGSYWFYHIDSGSQVSNSSNRGTVWSNGDVLGVALDIDNSRIDFYVNGSLAGSPNTNVDISATVNEIDSTGDFLIPFIGMWRSQFKLNFGGYTTHTIASAASDANGYGTFEYTPPSGYYALCTKNLAEYG